MESPQRKKEEEKRCARFPRADSLGVDSNASLPVGLIGGQLREPLFSPPSFLSIQGRWKRPTKQLGGSGEDISPDAL